MSHVVVSQRHVTRAFGSHDDVLHGVCDVPLEDPGKGEPRTSGWPGGAGPPGRGHAVGQEEDDCKRRRESNGH